jgi:DNA-binding transcriptional LysR family regulator
MELRQLEYFVAVAEEASFTRAAARTHVAQPGVSAQVRKLEAELGEPLLDRTGRAVRLTEAGAAVLPFARAALDAVAGARVAVDELRGLLRGRVAVGTIVAYSGPGTADLLAAFHREHPGVEIALKEAESDELLAGLRDGGLDLALVGLAGEDPPDLEVAVVRDEPLVVRVAGDHPLARRRSVTLAALVEHPLIALRRGTGGRTALEDACRRAGLAPHVAFEASDPRTVADLAARGLGAALLPASVAPDLHGVQVTRPALRSRLALAWRPGGANGPAARALIERARAAWA